jgi:hypothetical protein
MHIKITTDDLIDLLSVLNAELRTATIQDLLDIAETTNFSKDFLLEVAAFQVNIHRKTLTTMLRLEVEAAKAEMEAVQ